MKYASTRGAAPAAGFADALLTGLAPDGGLYVPESWPALAAPPPPGRPYAEVALDVMAPYVEGSLTRADLAAMIGEAYATFEHPEVCPLVELAPGLHLLELFHGPTLAFKDIALQLLGRLMDRELSARSERATVLVATSGDTGSAAIAACAGRPNLDIVVLHPHGRVSAVQRRQMTTVGEPNVHNIAVAGTFDDCQDLVKAMFADRAFRDRHRLAAMNSINWAREMAQIAYYVTAMAALGRCSFSVPTGNFGNVLAGWIAKAMGAPVERLVIATNRNDVLRRWVHEGALVLGEVTPTISPAMDIQVPSNHERLLFELLGRDGRAVGELMARLRSLGSVQAPRDPGFDAASIDDDQTLAVIGEIHASTGVLVDPHTAVGIGAARACGRDREATMVCLATAHPAKFPDPVEQATGVRPALPERLKERLAGEERYAQLPADLAALERHIDAVVSPR